MITIIYAPPRTGKTVLLTHIANQYAFDNDRNNAMQAEVQQKNMSGFNLTIPQHCVYANYDITLKKFRYSQRKSYKINPYRIGFANPYVKTAFLPPYSAIFITEAQKYLNSRMALYFPDWQSRWYEQHGHNNVDVFLDVQRPMLIDPNIRDLARFIEVVKLDRIADKVGRIQKLVWTVRLIDNAKLWEKYVASGSKDSSCFEERTIVADYNVFTRYNSFSCKPKFYDGHLYEDFSLEEYMPTEESLRGYIEYMKSEDDELPENFYMKRSTKNGKGQSD